jgi:hypothetical protein
MEPSVFARLRARQTVIYSEAGITVGAVKRLSRGQSVINAPGTIRARQLRLRQPGLRQPRLRQLRLRQPRLRQPRLRQPRLRQPRLRQEGSMLFALWPMKK